MYKKIISPHSTFEFLKFVFCKGALHAHITHTHTHTEPVKEMCVCVCVCVCVFGQAEGPSATFLLKLDCIS